MFDQENSGYGLDAESRTFSGLLTPDSSLETQVEALPDFVSVSAGQRPPVMLAIDVGTSGTRAALFDETGNEVPGANVRLDSKNLRRFESGMTDPDFLVEHVAETIDAVLAKASNVPSGRIEYVAISCFWHSLLGVDESNRPTTMVLGWSDQRASRAALELRAELDETRFHDSTGCRFHPSYWPAKLRRLKNEEPAIYETTRRWLSFADYLALQFTGDATTSVSMASGTGLMNQHSCEWEPELLTSLELSPANLPDIAPRETSLPQLNSNYALRWPQLADARMLPAIGDGAANNIGAGCLTAAEIALMVGTSGAMRLLYRGEPPRTLPPELWCYRAGRDRVLIGGAVSDGGSIYQWLKQSFFPDDSAEFIESELAVLKPDAHGLTILPFWMGERSPGWAVNASGAIRGLTLHTSSTEILRAAMEAVAYRFVLIAKSLATYAPDARIVASGHALRSSPTWLQILADVLARPIEIYQLAEASTRGAALLALEAVGKITNIEDFHVDSAWRLPPEEIVKPDMSRHAIYLQGLERQQRLYEQLIHNPDSNPG